MQKLHEYCQMQRINLPRISLRSEGEKHNLIWIASNTDFLSKEYRATSKKIAIHNCAKALLPVLVRQQTQHGQHGKNKDVGGDALHQFCTHYHKLGLVCPRFVLEQKGPRHMSTWVACLEGHESETFEANTQQAAKQKCAQFFLQQWQFKRDQATIDTVMYTMPSNATVTLNCSPDLKFDLMEDCPIQSLDLQWDLLTQDFVCASIATSLTNVLIFTNFDFLRRYINQSSCQFVMFGMEKAQRLFPELLQQAFVDLRQMLDKKVFHDTVGLRHLVAHCLHKELPKNLRTSFITSTSVSEEQIEYAATNAHAILFMYRLFVVK